MIHGLYHSARTALSAGGLKTVVVTLNEAADVRRDRPPNVSENALQKESVEEYVYHHVDGEDGSAEDGLDVAREYAQGRAQRIGEQDERYPVPEEEGREHLSRVQRRHAPKVSEVRRYQR